VGFRHRPFADAERPIAPGCDPWFKKFGPCFGTAQVMPREINYLAFSDAELSAALRHFRLSQGTLHPGDTVEHLAVRRAERTFHVVACVKDGRSGRVARVAVEPHEVLSALILFCKRAGIPLALRAHKTLDVVGGRVSLLSTANFAYSRPEERDGAIVYTDDDLEAGKACLQLR
jgi:hypothetical protein